jgi:hypothetical protein
MEETCVEIVEGAMNQLVTKYEVNLGLWANISRMECSFQRGIMLPIFINMWLNKL